MSDGLAVRFWDVNMAQVTYWNSSFLDHSTTNDVLKSFFRFHKTNYMSMP